MVQRFSSRLTGRGGRRALLAGAVVPVLLAGTSLSAHADSGGVCAVGCDASMKYHDTGDIIEVFDLLKDDHGAVGWISVQQADGSYKAFPHVYVGTGYNTDKAVVQDVLREHARIKLTACLQDGPTGKPWNCGFRYIDG